MPRHQKQLIASLCHENSADIHGIEVVYAANSAHISFTDTGSKIEFDILGWFGEGDEHLDPSLYSFGFLKTLNMGANQISTITEPDQNRTLGYIFPIFSLSDSTLYPRDADISWIDIYAGAASRAIISGELYHPRLFEAKSLDDLVGSEISLSDIFEENLAVLIVGNEQLNDSKISIEEVLISVNRNHYTPHLYDHGDEKEEPEDFLKKISIKKCSEDLNDQKPLLLRQLVSAGHDKNPFSKFLSIYQIIEIIIRHIFDYEMNQLINSIDTTSTDLWDLKEQIKELTGEKRRINRIQEFYLDKGLSGDIFETLKAHCDSLSFMEDNSQNHWTYKLYSVRNKIVHNQLAFQKPDIDELKQLNKTLLCACTDLICHFKLPASN